MPPDTGEQMLCFDAHTDFSPWSGAAGHDHKQVLRRVAALPTVRRIARRTRSLPVTLAEDRQVVPCDSPDALPRLLQLVSRAL